VQAVSRGIALNLLQNWLGHAQLTTTGDRSCPRAWCSSCG
jgi:hypothetical protein